MMELSSEDALRLNVLLANKPLAIRIDESKMTLHGLLQESEATVKLNPSGNSEKYLHLVRAFLSGYALGNPGGYPLYLQRWTRQGKMRAESMERLLLLGEPAAVFAVVCAEGLTDELARRAWWVVEEAENARRMLETDAVVQGATGKKLADYLVEYLPFETETESMMDSVRMALKPGLLDQQTRLKLWKKASRKTAYLVGFVAATPDDMPEKQLPRRDIESCQLALLPLIESGNRMAGLMLKLLSEPGQSFTEACYRILTKPSTQDVVDRTMGVIRGYFSPARPEGDPDLPLDILISEAAEFLQQSEDALACLNAVPELEPELLAMRVLSGLGYGVLRPELKGSTAMGSLMRRKLEPVLTPVMFQLGVLRGTNAG